MWIFVLEWSITHLAPITGWSVGTAKNKPSLVSIPLKYCEFSMF